MTAPAVTTPTVAVVGAGDIGVGWAALAAANSWRVTLYDIDARAGHAAMVSVARRARALVGVGSATPTAIEQGIDRLALGRSLLQAVSSADWIIEAATEDLGVKQRVIKAIDDVAKPDGIITSSSSAFAPADVAGRAQHRQRILVAHPLNPPEIIPLVELIPGPETAPDCVGTVRGWLRTLGRYPVTIHKSVPGYVAGRIAAAVWREAIQLVLEGVIDVEELDRAVSLGPALGWAAAGPHLTYHLGAGDRGVRVFLQQLLATFELLWEDLAVWSRLDPERQRSLEHAIERAYEGQMPELRAARDRRLAAILRAVEPFRS